MPWVFNQNNPKLNIEKRRLGNKIFINYIRQKKIKKCNPIVNISKNEARYEQLKNLITDMCQLSEEKRPDFSKIMIRLEQMKFQGFFTR